MQMERPLHAERGEEAHSSATPAEEVGENTPTQSGDNTDNSGHGADNTGDGVTQATTHKVNECSTIVISDLSLFGGIGGSGGHSISGLGGHGGLGEGASLKAGTMVVHNVNQYQHLNHILQWAVVPAQLAAPLVTHYLPGNSDLQPQTSLNPIHVPFLLFISSIQILLLILTLFFPISS
ncbi:hypothetical protein B0H14DRAFT_2756548 [Mycena olivaceomarginata]|nr:hypothetical protein B0H14DRAFT_2756548 [Mycena olivaceomarginata]